MGTGARGQWGGDMAPRWGPLGDRGHSQGIGQDQQVGVVKEGCVRPLHQQQERGLDAHHEQQLPNATDVQEDGAGEQAEHHAVAEVLGGTWWDAAAPQEHQMVPRNTGWHPGIVAASWEPQVAPQEPGLAFQELL